MRVQLDVFLTPTAQGQLAGTQRQLAGTGIKLTMKGNQHDSIALPCYCHKLTMYGEQHDSIDCFATLLPQTDKQAT